ncbi:MAG: hypothetical protein RR364_03075 [Lachnospiraceae bacterium]
MNTKPVPAVTTLIAGVVVCILGYIKHMELGNFLQLLLFVLLGFYVIGGVVRLILDKNFEKMKEEEILEPDLEEQEEGSPEIENIE